MLRRRQEGMTAVEFSIVASVLFIMIFGVIEIARAFFVYAALDEVTRRGARVAAVCPVNDPAIAQMAVFNTSGDAGASNIVPGLTPANITVEYLDQNNTVVANPGDPAGFFQIRFVRVRVTGFQHQLFIPLLATLTNFGMPEFSTVLPRESLGIPRDGAVTPC